jgi:hypothetical protein
MTEKPQTRTTEQARAGESRGHMRYVLLISVIIAVAVIAWLALRTDVASQSGNVTGPAAEAL